MYQVTILCSCLHWVFETLYKPLLEAYHRLQESYTSSQGALFLYHPVLGKEMSLQPPAHRDLRGCHPLPVSFKPWAVNIHPGLGVHGKTHNQNCVSGGVCVLFYFGFVAFGIVSHMYKYSVRCVCMHILMKLRGYLHTKFHFLSNTNSQIFNACVVIFKSTELFQGKKL